MQQFIYKYWCNASNDYIVYKNIVLSD